MSRIYIIDLWLDSDELAFLGFRLLSVRLNSAGQRELVVEVREPAKRKLGLTVPQCGTLEELADRMLESFEQLTPQEQEQFRKKTYEQITGMPYRPYRRRRSLRLSAKDGEFLRSVGIAIGVR